MDKCETEKHCALCRTLLKNNTSFNLNSDISKYSHTALIAMIENIAGTLCLPHFDICLHCYDLVNEFDSIELRQLEIRNQFKLYLENSKENISNVQDLTESIRNTDNVLDLLTCNGSAPEININSDISTETIVLESAEDYFKTECSIDQNNTLVENNEKLVPKKRSKKKISEILKPHRCHCSKEFKTAGELKKHMNTHDDRRAFICEICGQSYKHQAAFNIHMNIHEGINPFTCVYCNKSFTQKGALVRHVPIHTGEKPYQCDECGKCFIHHTSFNIHRLSHTGLKSYKCTLCGLRLMSGSHLKRHMRIHTGEKKFLCRLCGKSFAEKYNLAVHEKLHTNPCSSVSQKRNYSCQMCGVNFERKVKLEEHLVKEHEMKIVKSELNHSSDFTQPSLVNNTD